MHPSRSAAALLLSLGACTAGDDAADTRVERADSAGIEIVTNHAADRPLDWSPEPLVSIGETEGPRAFGALWEGGVATDAARRIYVLDSQAQTVHVFTEDGTPVRRIGRRGRGPGEFESPNALAVEPDGTIGVFAFDKMGLVRFDSAGEPLPEWRTPMPPVLTVAFAGGGAVYLAYPRADGEVETLVRQREATIDTVWIGVALTRREIRLPDCRISLRLAPLLSPEVVWDAAGDRIAVAQGTAYVVDVWNGGHIGRSIRREMPALNGTLDMAAAEVPDTVAMMAGPHHCRIPGRQFAELRGYQSVAPHVVAVALSPDGGVWVRRRTADGTRRTDVFDAEGRYRGTLPPRAPWPAAFLGGDRLVAVERDELDVPRVVVYPAPRLE